MYMDPMILLAAASFCAGMVGYHFGRRSDEEIVMGTINYLINNNFVRSYENEDGELEILKLDE